jgi:predicted nuclease of restriction endonuclease-like RecB superfamily
LGELVQFLPHCAKFKLRAECVLHDQEAVLDVQSGDPIFPAESPAIYDSKLEERFARDFKRAAPDWDLVREPEPVPAGRTLIFPDFLLHHRLCPQRRFFVEILGFWSADYLVRKLALLREAGLPNLILCVDEVRGDDLLPIDARIVRFRRCIDPRMVLAAAGEKWDGPIEKRHHDREREKSGRRSAP